ncbi:nitroreductase [Prauserella sp. PE36]|uniref:Nitroreductase n=1 Tax=Prauserella endophytica TaxID=1592324 RepID=A0ABY2S650_9PSEU|nr:MULTISPECIES: nitroreductase family protein [Prauserella]PXY30113.1 nitroreductase [Prauserella coralliicola]RBM22565.1 nitroreductase [Prauserella sp. PE36]TKG71178.1 nitroreductase [Prauserella endophytica]
MESAAAEWSAGEIDVLARAVVHAPSVHNMQPWSLELPDGEALLVERTDLALPCHDPAGRDRAVSCGAAAANLELGMRVLGRATRLALLPDPDRPDLVARITAGEVRLPSGIDLHRYSAIARRRSYRHAFTGQCVSDYDLADLVAASPAEGVTARPLRGAAELTALADVLEYAGAAVRQDDGYQRELALWTARDIERAGDGLALAAVASTLPWAGLVRPGTALPDRETLAARLGRETVLVFVTTDDTRLDHVRTGVAMEQTWLAAVDMGLAAAVQTQPLHLAEARSALIENLGLPGYPQLLMRVGHPAVAVPRSPRRAIRELLDRDAL